MQILKRSEKVYCCYFGLVVLTIMIVLELWKSNSLLHYLSILDNLSVIIKILFSHHWFLFEFWMMYVSLPPPPPQNHKKNFIFTSIHNIWKSVINHEGTRVQVLIKVTSPAEVLIGRTITLSWGILEKSVRKEQSEFMINAKD